MKKFKFFIIFIFSTLLVLAFQNCGNVKVQVKEQASSAPTPKAVIMPQGSVCSGTGAQFGTPVRFTFVVDMSLSNLGGSVTTTAGDGISLWSLNLSESTDLNNKRFDAMKKFISTCGNSSEFKYSILGFSDQAMFPTAAKRCTSSFESSTDAIVTVNGLQKIQADDIKQNGSYSYSSPFKMGDTSYNKGLDCLRVNIQADASIGAGNGDTVPIYQTFLLTDGKPTDFLTLAEQKANYLATLKNLFDFALPFSNGIKIKTLYYGPPSEKASATQILDAIAQSTGEMVPDPNFPEDASKAKPPVTLEVNDMDNVAAQLCQLYKPQATYAFRSYKQYAININRTQYLNQFEADSDADGISDKEEIKLSFDALNPRTNGVLDSLCLRAGYKVSTCKAPPSCTQLEVGFGLNDCDIKFASQYFGKNLSGFDTDSDSIVDYIEIIKGTNPVSADMQNDLDRDGISNIKEIVTGSNVQNKNKFSDEDLTKFNWGISRSNQNCASNAEESYDYNFEQLPISKGLNYNNSSVQKINFNHLGEENVYLVFYLTEPRGSTTLQNKLNVVKIVVTETGSPKQEPAMVIGDFKK